MINRIIINSDDFGITEGVNKAIIELADAGILTSTSAMTNMPHCSEILSVKDKIGIGIHLTLTEGRPVLSPKEIPSLVDENGFFFPLRVLTKKSVYRKISKEEVGKELTAQIAKLFALGIKPSHIDSHESFLKNPFLVQIIKKLGLKHSIPSVRTYNYMRFDYQRLLNPRKLLISILLFYQKMMWKKAGFHVTDKINSLNGHSCNYTTAIEKLRDIFHNLPDGVLEIVVHPGYCSGDDTPLGDYVKEREVELQALSSNEFKRIIKNSGAELISYNDI